MLFRNQIIERKTAKHLGKILLYSRPSFWYISMLIVAIFIGVISFIAFGEYKRKERVLGLITPSDGLVSLNSPKFGIFEDVYVDLGQYIDKGTPLLKIKNQTVLYTGQQLSESLLEQLENEKNNLNKIKNNILKSYTVSGTRLKNRKEGLLSEVKRYEFQVKLSERIIELDYQKFKTMEGLFKKNAASKLEVTSSERNYLESQLNLNILKNNLAKTFTEIKTLETELLHLPIQKSNEENEIQRRLNELEQTIVQTHASENFILNAPISGTVASLVARKGQQASPEKIAVSILPSGGKLQAELYVPARAIGFISEGQMVRLKYEAFPYQKFGIYNGRVQEISKTVMTGADLVIAPQITEPFFLVIVAIKDQSVDAFGKSIPLQSGMSLTADIILEERKIWEWVFEPLIGVYKEF